MTDIKHNIFTPVLIGGSLILLISFAIRSTFGLFQIPIADQFMWARSEFSMAIAIQNLAWGIGTPIFSAFAEKFGQNDKIIEEIEAPGWDEALVRDLTERYDIDVRSIDKISTVQFISPE